VGYNIPSYRRVKGLLRGSQEPGVDSGKMNIPAFELPKCRGTSRETCG